MPDIFYHYYKGQATFDLYKELRWEKGYSTAGFVTYGGSIYKWRGLKSPTQTGLRNKYQIHYFEMDRRLAKKIKAYKEQLASQEITEQTNVTTPLTTNTKSTTDSITKPPVTAQKLNELPTQDIASEEPSGTPIVLPILLLGGLATALYFVVKR